MAASFERERLVARMLRLVREASTTPDGKGGERKVSTEDVARRCREITGKVIDSGRICVLESGQHAVNSDSVEMIAAALGLTPIQFYERGVALVKAADRPAI